MGVLSKGTDFSNGQQITDNNLDALVDNATFTVTAVDADSTTLSQTGAIIVKDGGIKTAKLENSTSTDNGVTTAKIATEAVTTTKIADLAVITDKLADSTGALDGVTTAKIATGAVTTDKLAASAVTKAKIENVNNMKVLGNTSGSATAPQEVSVINAASGINNNNNDTSIPTSAAVLGLFTLSGSNLTINI